MCRPVVPDQHPVRCYGASPRVAETAGAAMPPGVRSAHIPIGWDDPSSKLALIGVWPWYCNAGFYWNISFLAGVSTLVTHGTCDHAAGL